MPGQDVENDVLLFRKANFYPKAISIFLFLSYLLLIGSAVAKFASDWPDNDDFGTVKWYQQVLVSHESNAVDVVKAHEEIHPIGAQLAITLVLFYSFGVHFIIAIWFNAIIILVSATLLVACLSGLYHDSIVKLLLPLSVLALSFHPVQTTHLIWAFEMGWFIINSALFCNALLLEKWGFKATPFVLAFLLLGSFASAHACILWVGAALHVGIIRDFRHKYVCLISSFIGFCLNIAGVIYSSQAKPEAVNHVNYMDMFYYFVSLLGSMFSTRSENALFILGLIVLSCILFQVLQYAVKRSRSELERIALVFTVASMGFLAVFAAGRYQYGLSWALDDFHMGPLLVPLLLGVTLAAFRSYDRADSSFVVKALSAGVAVFILASVPFSLPYMLERGGSMAARAALAMHVACNPGYSRYIIENANIAPGYYDLIEDQLTYIQHLCRSDAPKVTLLLQGLRARYLHEAASRPQVQDALTALWEVYATHDDLQNAYPPNSSDSPDALVAWARDDALEGSVYEPERLSQYSAIFQSLAAK
jgi:hypothetical protein